jgi:DNA-binding CsgD family transcriptional regulator
MEPSARPATREVSSLSVVPSLTIEDSDAAVYSITGGIVACMHQRPPDHPPRLFFAYSIDVLTRQHLQFTPNELTSPLLPPSNCNQALFVRHRGTLFGILAVPTPLFSLIRLEQISTFSGWLLYLAEQTDRIHDTIPVRSEATWHVFHTLTARQREVLTLLVRGNTRQQIADQLDRAVSTIHSHCDKIFHALDVNSAPEAIAIGRAAGLA